MKKLIGAVLCIAMLVAVFSFAACGEESGGKNTLVIEAEYVNLDDVKGSGLSNDQSGVNMIYGKGTQEEKDKGWSNGYYIGYTYTSECSIDFVFTADSAATASIIVRLGSELGNLTLTPDNVQISLNGKAINYGSVYVEGSDGMDNMKFSDKTVSASETLVAGENVVNIKILPNDLRGNGTGGPTIDYVKIESDAKLSYNPKTDNPSRIGEM